MKKILTIILSLTFVLALVGCGKTIIAAEVYSFPEPTTQIVISHVACGGETEYTIGSENYDVNDLSTLPIIEWFYGLQLEECEKPEDVEGGEGYSFTVDGKYAFSYDDRGNESFIFVNDTWYTVKNPSVPPIE